MAKVYHYFYINPIQAGPPELTIQAGGGQKRLRYIIGPYLSDFKSDFIRVKSKSELHIIRSHLEKKICKKLDLNILKIDRERAILS